jgi:hypothetical protein
MIATRPVAALALLLALAGCGGIDFGKVKEKSLGDRCGEVMQQAFPEGEIEVTGTRTLAADAQQSLATIRLVVEGRRSKLPANSRLRRDVAVECRFDQGILTGFRWTEGPLQ